MKRLKTHFVAGFCLAQGFFAAAATAQSFDAYLSRYPKARLVQSNSEALKLRLALLDLAPAGSQVKIATYVFDYGKAVRTLTAHMCAASRRGVSVELVVDSKSGDRVDADDAADGKPEVKQAEELYQVMANCGVKVFIHNSNVDFVSVVGRRMPNIFGVPAGSSVNPVTALSRIKEIRKNFAGVLQPSLQRMGVRSPILEPLSTAMDLALETQHLMGIAASENETPVEQAIENMTRSWRHLITDSFWREMDVTKTLALGREMKRVLTEDPQISFVREKIRAFNRLNHRKLFMIETAPGKGCAVIGGRNLGDHYLTDEEGSFHDADILICNHHHAEADLLVFEAGNSFEELKQNHKDLMISRNDSVTIREVPANPSYKYKHLDPRLVVPARIDTAEAVKGTDLPDLDKPLLLKSSWDPQGDQIRSALLEAITREQKEIYIETAYAEFNSALRRALVKALERGVRVRIVTNGLALSDGPSKLIRIWMAAWNYRMARAYPKLFSSEFSAIAGRHMIHFKGAGFRCQKGANGGGYYRTYIMGSHNFHPRSGYSDKEHAIEWREATDANCGTPQSDLIAARKAYYEKVRQERGVRVLTNYYDLYAELVEVMRQKRDPEAATLARALIRTAYKYDGKTGKFHLRYEQELEHIYMLIEQSGIRDLVGMVL